MIFFSTSRPFHSFALRLLLSFSFYTSPAYLVIYPAQPSAELHGLAHPDVHSATPDRVTNPFIDKPAHRDTLRIAGIRARLQCRQSVHDDVARIVPFAVPIRRVYVPSRHEHGDEHGLSEPDTESGVVFAPAWTAAQRVVVVVFFKYPASEPEPAPTDPALVFVLFVARMGWLRVSVDVDVELEHELGTAVAQPGASGVHVRPPRLPEPAAIIYTLDVPSKRSGSDALHAIRDVHTGRGERVCE